MKAFIIYSYSDVQDVTARAHLFYSAKKQFIDTELESFARNSENCRRKMLLESIGGSLKGRNDYGCCDVCSVECVHQIATLCADLPKHLSFIAIHNRTVNVEGKAGRGKPLDQMIEHYNL